MIQDQRSQGRSAVLREIRRAGDIARVDLARRTGLSQATVTAITAELLRSGLIAEDQPGQRQPLSRRGRPRVGLHIRGEAFLVAGVKAAGGRISVALLDFAGRDRGAHDCATPAVLSPGDFAAAVLAAVAEAAVLNGHEASDVRGIGIGITGFVDAPHGLVHWSAALDQRNVDLRAVFAAQTDMPVFIDNDANLVALAELYFGHGRGVEDFLVVTVESGVGFGMVLGGQVYRGTRGCGAEFGHAKVALDGALCRCGQQGCLEAYVGDYAVLREAAGLPGLEGQPDPDRAMAALMAAAGAGVAGAAEVLSRAGRVFAMGLANLVNIFDPQLIILSGERQHLDHLYSDAVLGQVAGLIVKVDVPPPDIVVHRWGDRMWAQGAAAYAIEALEAQALVDLGVANAS